MRSCSRLVLVTAISALAAIGCDRDKPEGASAPVPAASGTPTGVSSNTPAVAASALSPAPSAVSTAHVPKDLPIGVSPSLYAITVPANAVPTPERVALGEKLFNDKRLSLDDSTSCATCHDPARGFVDHEVTSVGIKSQRGQRNAPTILNAMFNGSQFWDGRAATLEDQAKLPIINPIEMGMPNGEAVVVKVRAIPEYVDAFQKQLGRPPTFDDIAAAIAAFERTQFAGESPFDRFIQGDENALDASQKRGWALFNGKARCTSCHAGNAVQPLFSDQKFHNIGVAAHKQNFAALAREALGIVRSGDQQQIDQLAIETKFAELGRFLVTKQTNDVGSFKTPTLRNIAATGPYMHDGSLATLWDVMDHYNKGGVANPFLDGGMQRLGLTEPEIDDMVAFMTSLTTDKIAPFAKAEMAKQTAQKGKRPERNTAVAMGQKGDLGDLAPNPDLAVKDPARFGVFGRFPQAPVASAKAKTERGESR